MSKRPALPRCGAGRRAAAERVAVPRLSAFYGITIWMYYAESGHTVPHFHARYAGDDASFSMDGRLLAGGLPSRPTRLVLDWAALHRDELLLNWHRIRRGQAIAHIEALP